MDYVHIILRYKESYMYIDEFLQLQILRAVHISLRLVNTV